MRRLSETRDVILQVPAGIDPLVTQGVLSTDAAVVDSKSGVSGAGRDVVLDSLFCEVNEGVKAYKLFEHRHLPEMRVN